MCTRRPKLGKQNVREREWRKDGESERNSVGMRQVAVGTRASKRRERKLKMGHLEEETEKKKSGERAHSGSRTVRKRDRTIERRNSADS